jgi:L,D-peptidoglycan transpeptidase YkuD (ErfK/YbiS/YcfS/YnhG family)
MIRSRLLRSRLAAGALLLSLCAGVAAAGPRVDDASRWQSSRQLVLVTVADWSADHGTLRTFTRGGHGWVATGVTAPVTIGRGGAGWGPGLNAARGDGPLKHEGDGRSPAGVFRIGQVFGYAAHADTTMPYRALSATDYCVDVVGATHYNRIVDANVVGADAVKGSTEPMRRDIHLNGDQHYRLGFEIEQNWQSMPGAGSCIFGHLWGSPTEATVGCTAMAPAVMQSLVAWLKPGQEPIFVLLPQSAYLKLRADWQLPVIDSPPSP